MSDSPNPLSVVRDYLHWPRDSKRLAGVCAAGAVLLALMLVSGGSSTEKPDSARSEVDSQTVTAEAEPTSSVDAQQAALAAEREHLQSEVETLKLEQEVAALRRELERLQTSEVSTPTRPKPSAYGKVWRSRTYETSTVPAAAEARPASTANKEVAPTLAGERTLVFWNSMNDIIEREGQMRAAPLGGMTSANAGGFFDARIQAGEFAVTALEALDTRGVDQRAIAVAASVKEWYENGQDVAQTGRNLLTRGSTAERKGAAGQRYQSSEWEHSRTVDAVNAAGERVRQQLIRDYGIEFPPLK